MMKESIMCGFEKNLAIDLWNDDGLGHAPVTILDPTPQDSIIAKHRLSIPPLGLLIVSTFLLLPCLLEGVSEDFKM